MENIDINQLVILSKSTQDNPNKEEATLILSQIPADFSSLELTLSTLFSSEIIHETIIYCLKLLNKIIKSIHEIEQIAPYIEQITSYFINNFKYIKTRKELHFFSADLLANIFKLFPTQASNFYHFFPKKSKFSLFLISRYVFITNNISDYIDIFEVALQASKLQKNLPIILQNDTLSSTLALYIYKKIGIKTIFNLCSQISTNCNISFFISRILHILQEKQLNFLEDCLENLFIFNLPNASEISSLLSQISILKIMKFSPLWCKWLQFMFFHLILGFIQKNIYSIENCLLFFTNPFSCINDEPNASLFYQ